jgi:sn-glycerol 3-phosphate transport system substrate-binding protein
MRIHLLHRSLIAILVAILAFGTTANAQRVEVEFWHGLSGALGELLEGTVADFNASQDSYQVNPSFKGSYDETMNAAIAAFRAGTAPHIVQMYEVGTATMMYAGGAIKPVHELMAETGVPFDPSVYLPAIKGYYSLLDGSMMSMPFNSSTAVMWVNDTKLAAAGIDPATVSLDTWEEVREVAKQVVDTGASTCGFSMAWPTWTQVEQFSAIHDVPIGTLSNGLEGLETEFLINSPLHVKHLQTLIDMQAEGSFTYGGRGNAGDALFASGECAIVQGSSALVARVRREATFDWSVHMLPYYAGTPGAPLNSIIGGASFWVMQAPNRTAEEFRAVAEFFAYISTLEAAEKWHVDSGYLPIRFGVYEKLAAEGYYDDQPAMEIPYLQLTRGTATPNSLGLRFGNMPAIRVIFEEEIELALQGQQTAQQALDTAVERGNVVLRAFERANR